MNRFYFPSPAFSVGFHDVAYTSTKERSRVSELKAARSADPFYSDCNQLKSCFGSPEGCVESGSCSAVASVRVEGTRHTFELKAESAAYIALGLSTDNKMVGDFLDIVPKLKSKQLWALIIFLKYLFQVEYRIPILLNQCWVVP